jgi:hypothetical protein
MISTYEIHIGHSYRISVKMPTEWPKMAELALGNTLRILNNIKAVSGQRRYRMAEAVFDSFSEGEYRR